MNYVIGISIITLIINNIYKKIRETRREEIIMTLSIISLYYILYNILIFNTNNQEYQNRYEILGINNGIDGISIILIGLIGILEPIIILLIRGDAKREEKKIINIIEILKILIIIIFNSLDILLFFIGFELILIPMFLLIINKGSKYKYYIPRIEAGLRFFIYTMIGSIMMLITIIIFYMKFGTTNNEILNIKINEYMYVGGTNAINIINILWLLIFFSFLIKIPTFPFHLWLPLAHSDAPTIGSIILAAILLKLASFGIIRYSLYLFSNDWIFIGDKFIPVIYILALLSIIYSSIIPIRSLFDMKKIIAYSSIIHMNFSIFGFFNNFELSGLLGSTLLIFSHAFISGALFLLVGILYKRFFTRNVLYLQGIFSLMPIFSFFFLFFSFANISVPFCLSFLSELFILLSISSSNLFITIVLLFSLFLSTSFFIWITNRLLFASPSSYLASLSTSYSISDLSPREFLTLLPFFFFTLFFTFFPSFFISFFVIPLSILS